MKVVSEGRWERKEWKGLGGWGQLRNRYRGRDLWIGVAMYGSGFASTALWMHAEVLEAKE